MTSPRIMPRRLRSVAALLALLATASGLPASASMKSDLSLGSRATHEVLIVAAGDIACDPSSGSFNRGSGTTTACRAAATEKLIVGLQPRLVLPLGDEQYQDGALAEFHHSYALSWGRQRSKTRPVTGNHEYETPGARGYFRYFGAHAGPSRRGWYSYNLHGWHLIALDSNCDVVRCGSHSRQYHWLRKDLRRHRARCTLAYWHHPRFSSGPHGDDSDVAGFWRLLYDAGADVVLNGHDHIYERFAPLAPSGHGSPWHGIRQFTVGTGGAEHYWIAHLHPGSVVRNARTFGVLAVFLRRGGYRWRFAPIAGSVFTDSGWSRCHGA